MGSALTQSPSHSNHQHPVKPNPGHPTVTQITRRTVTQSPNHPTVTQITPVTQTTQSAVTQVTHGQSSSHRPNHPSPSTQIFQITPESSQVQLTDFFKSFANFTSDLIRRRKNIRSLMLKWTDHSDLSDFCSPRKSAFSFDRDRKSSPFQMTTPKAPRTRNKIPMRFSPSFDFSPIPKSGSHTGPSKSRSHSTYTFPPSQRNIPSSNRSRSVAKRWQTHSSSVPSRTSAFSDFLEPESLLAPLARSR